MSNQFINQYILTGRIVSQERKTSRQGNSYVDGICFVDRLKMELPFQSFLPDPLEFPVGQMINMAGRLRYENHLLQLVIEEINTENVNTAINQCKLTLLATSDGEMKYSAKGTPWAYIRAALSMGKNKKGRYRPSWWLEVKGFGNAENETIPASIYKINKGEWFTATGKLHHRTYQNRLYWCVIANEPVQAFDEYHSATQAEPVPD